MKTRTRIIVWILVWLFTIGMVAFTVFSGINCAKAPTEVTIENMAWHGETTADDKEFMAFHMRDLTWDITWGFFSCTARCEKAGVEMVSFWGKWYKSRGQVGIDSWVDL